MRVILGPSLPPPPIERTRAAPPHKGWRILYSSQSNSENRLLTLSHFSILRFLHVTHSPSILLFHSKNSFSNFVWLCMLIWFLIRLIILLFVVCGAIANFFFSWVYYNLFRGSKGFHCDFAFFFFYCLLFTPLQFSLFFLCSLFLFWVIRLFTERRPVRAWELVFRLLKLVTIL